MIVITTPSGHVGSAAAERLISGAEPLSLVTRHPEKVQALVKRGAFACEGSLDDKEFLVEATRGANVLLWITPPAMSDNPREEQRRFGRAAAEAIKANEIRWVVNLSSVGAHLGEHCGPISGLAEIEHMLDDTGANVLHLRAGWFYENFLQHAASIAASGTFSLPLDGQRKLVCVAADDVGDFAARRAQLRDWRGRTVAGVQGPTDLSLREAAMALGKGVEREIRFVHVSPASTRRAMLQAGLAPTVADGVLEMYAGLSEGRIARDEPRTASTTTPTTLRSWAGRILKPAVASAMPNPPAARGPRV